MAGQDKITKYRLENRVLELSGKPRTSTYEIAEAVTQELKAKGIEDSVSQSTVSRFLARIRKDRSEQTRSVVQEHIKEVVPKDLEALEEIERWFLGIFRSQKEVLKIRADMLKDEEVQKLLAAIEQTPGGSYDLKTRGNAALNALKVIELKLKYSGILETPNDDEEAKRLAKEIEDELDPELEQAVNDLGAGKDQAGV